MDKVVNENKIKDYILIIVGTFILGLAINTFFEKQGLVTGGFTGLAIIIKHVTKNLFEEGIDLGVTNLVLNLPLLIIGLSIKGKKFVGKTLFSTIFLSIALYISRNVPVATDDLLLSSVFGGIFAGIGLGLVFMAYATTGGTDLAASIMQHYIKHYSIARIMLCLDSIIIFLGMFIFGIEKTMFAIIAVFITAKVIDDILEGINFSKAAFIISDNYNEISKELLKQLDRGVTGLDGKGMFTDKEKKVLFCVVSKKETVQLKEIVRKIDTKAFVIVADVREVLGEGFKEYNV